MRDLPENVQTTIVFVTGSVVAIIAVALAIVVPWLLAVFALIGVLLWLYERYQPFSAFAKMRRLHPQAREVIDEEERRFAQDRTQRERRVKAVKAELDFLVSRLEIGRDVLRQIERMQLEHPFDGKPALDAGFQEMVEHTIKDTVRSFLELTTEEANAYIETYPSSYSRDKWQ